MIFSSLTFLLVFLPLLIIIYFVIPPNYYNVRKYILLFFSILFYAAGEPIYIILILACVICTWLLSGKIGEGVSGCLFLAIVINLLPLIFFKYSDFIVENTIALTEITGLWKPEITLPIGISFYTFQILAYAIDLYKGRVERQKNLLNLALYVMFFPQLIAGPIVRYQEVKDAIENDCVSWNKIKNGTGRFIFGLSKKVLIANQVGFVATEIMSHPLDSISTGLLWLAVVSFTLQIYFDFSGYSDMAIGLGSIFGFCFPENFRKPYISTSVTDFWRRWHITLGSFFRDYVYIPLGGNRIPTGRWMINVVIVWILTGLWHGAAWNYAIWGGYYAVLLILEKKFFSRWIRLDNKAIKCLRWAITMFFVSFGWAIFMADGYTMQHLFAFLGRMFYEVPLENKVTIASMGLYGYLPYVALGALISFPSVIIIDKISGRIMNIGNKIVAGMHDIILIAMLLFSVFFIIGGSYNPFIYYRF